ncbi:MAG: hypothetical protein Q9165_005755 [Trypethelium subeluteriae]
MCPKKLDLTAEKYYVEKVAQVGDGIVSQLWVYETSQVKDLSQEDLLRARFIIAKVFKPDMVDEVLQRVPLHQTRLDQEEETREVATSVSWVHLALAKLRDAGVISRLQPWQSIRGRAVRYVEQKKMAGRWEEDNHDGDVGPANLHPGKIPTSVPTLDLLGPPPNSEVTPPTDDDDGVECKHGPQECLGNILELCAASIYPDPKVYLGFAMCLTGHFEEIPQRDLISDCSLEHGIDFDKLNDCVSKDDGAYGIELLRRSVVRTAEAGVTKSCTVRLKNQIRTIRDGGRWKDYEGGHDVSDLISDIKRLYQASDEEWVPRRVPQPANAKASNSKTAKAHKPTRIPTLYNARPKGQADATSLSEAQSFLAAESNGLVEPSPPVEPLTSSDSLRVLEVPTVTVLPFSTLITSTLDVLTITTPSIGASVPQTLDILTSISTEPLSAYEPSDLPGEAVQEF